MPPEPACRAALQALACPKTKPAECGLFHAREVMTMIDNGQPQEEQTPSGGMTICINVSPDGSITVSSEEYEQEGQGQPAQTIGEALKLALQMYQQGDAGNEESQVQAGFQQSGGPMQNKPGMPGMPGMKGPM